MTKMTTETTSRFCSLASALRVEVYDTNRLLLERVETPLITRIGDLTNSLFREIERVVHGSDDRDTDGKAHEDAVAFSTKQIIVNEAGFVSVIMTLSAERKPEGNTQEGLYELHYPGELVFKLNMSVEYRASVTGAVPAFAIIKLVDRGASPEDTTDRVESIRNIDARTLGMRERDVMHLLATAFLYETRNDAKRYIDPEDGSIVEERVVFMAKESPHEGEDDTATEEDESSVFSTDVPFSAVYAGAYFDVITRALFPGSRFEVLSSLDLFKEFFLCPSVVPSLAALFWMKCSDSMNEDDCVPFTEEDHVVAKKYHVERIMESPDENAVGREIALSTNYRHHNVAIALNEFADIVEKEFSDEDALRAVPSIRAAAEAVYGFLDPSFQGRTPAAEAEKFFREFAGKSYHGQRDTLAQKLAISFKSQSRQDNPLGPETTPIQAGLVISRLFHAEAQFLKRARADDDLRSLRSKTSKAPMAPSVHDADFFDIEKVTEARIPVNTINASKHYVLSSFYGSEEKEERRQHILLQINALPEYNAIQRALTRLASDIDRKSAHVAARHGTATANTIAYRCLSGLQDTPWDIFGVLSHWSMSLDKRLDKGLYTTASVSDLYESDALAYKENDNEEVTHDIPPVRSSIIAKERMKSDQTTPQEALFELSHEIILNTFSKTSRYRQFIRHARWVLFAKLEEDMIKGLNSLHKNEEIDNSITMDSFIKRYWIKENESGNEMVDSRAFEGSTIHNMNHAHSIRMALEIYRVYFSSIVDFFVDLHNKAIGVKQINQTSTRAVTSHALAIDDIRRTTENIRKISMLEDDQQNLIRMLSSVNNVAQAGDTGAGDSSLRSSVHHIAALYFATEFETIFTRVNLSLYYIATLYAMFDKKIIDKPNSGLLDSLSLPPALKEHLFYHIAKDQISLEYKDESSNLLINHALEWLIKNSVSSSEKAALRQEKVVVPRQERLMVLLDKPDQKAAFKTFAANLESLMIAIDNQLMIGTGFDTVNRYVDIQRIFIPDFMKSTAAMTVPGQHGGGTGRGGGGASRGGGASKRQRIEGNSFMD